MQICVEGDTWGLATVRVSHAHTSSPGLAMLRRMAGRSFRFHFCISSSILSILAGFSAHRQPLRDELLVLFSTFSKHLFNDRLCLTEFFHPSGAVCGQRREVELGNFFYIYSHLP